MRIFKKLFARHRPLGKGFYHYRGGGQFQGFRMHLRIEDDGRGILVINASKVLHLNQTAAEITKYIIEEKPIDLMIKEMRRRYRVNPEILQRDYQSLKEKIFTLAESSDVCPITFLDIERIEPFETPVSAPYRMDLALTYACDNTCGHCYLSRTREMKELSTEEWKRVMEKLWEIGIPHICFTGGEATLRTDLIDLITYAEEIGLVTGLLTNGRKMSNKELVQRMVEAGIDHFQITLEAHDEATHNKMVGMKGAWKETVEGIKNAVETPVYTITNTTITKLNSEELEKTIDFIHSLGIGTFAANGLIYSGKAPSSGIGFREQELAPILGQISEAARRNNMRFIWYTPTQYCNLNPVNLHLGPKTCTAAKYNMCLEPDGTVIPCQSYYEPLGNILTDSWEKIWNSAVGKALRERKLVMEKCKTCEELSLCGGGCPIYNRQEEILCVESKSNA
ncbi:MAG: radical SAM protein [Candidatus Edwardsbacteria bacterium]